MRCAREECPNWPGEGCLRGVVDCPVDEWGRVYGYCNACGEEAPMDTECCDDGEVVEWP